MSSSTLAALIAVTPSLPAAPGHCVRVLLKGCCFILFAAGLVSACLAEEPAGAVLKKAAEVMALPAESAARHLPVEITGVVTVAEDDWNGRFFVQDETGGIFVMDTSQPKPATGDRVVVEGVTSRGAFAPIVNNPHWTKVGTGPLPRAKRVPIENLIAGQEDSQRVEVQGLVRAVRTQGPRFMVDLSVGGYQLHVLTSLGNGLNVQALIGSKVKVRGTAAASFNAKLRHLTSVNLYVPSAADFVVEEAEQENPFNQETVPVNSVARFHPNGAPSHRIHIKGTVTYQRVGEDLFVQDASGGLHIRSAQLTPFTPGDVIEAVGFLDLEGYLPVLNDAILRKSPAESTPLQALVPPVSEVLDGLHPSELITLRGKLLDRTVRSIRRETSGFSGRQISWWIQDGHINFTADLELPAGELPEEYSIPAGSVVEVSGVCFSETGDDGKLKALRLLLPTADNIRVIEKASWFTPQHLTIGLGIASAVLLAVAGWTLTVSKKNAVLVFLNTEREKAQKALQEAHDTLEQKVKERTEQLKFEVTSRKTAEVQFKAVLGERTRLAQELHDSLEQTLTGIGLQLDTAIKLFPRSVAEAAGHLELARNWMKQSQMELRRSIWDLRSRELDEFELSSALLRSGRQITTGTNIQFDMETIGQAQPLPEIVEENILRIGQEALTNVVKHSGASKAKLELEFLPGAVVLRVSDNGKGIHPQTGALDKNHFGLLGMSERIKRLHGRFELTGDPGQGVTVCAEIPLDQGGEPEAMPSSAGRN